MAENEEEAEKTEMVRPRFDLHSSNHSSALGSTRSVRRLAINLATSSAGYVKVGSWRATDAAITLAETVLFPGGTIEAPDDEPARSVNIGGIVAGLVVGAFLITVLVVWWQRRHNKKIVRALSSQLQELKESAVGMRFVTEAWDPREGAEEGEASPRGPHRAKQRGGFHHRVVVDPTVEPEAVAVTIERATWYWQEDEHKIAMHAPHTVLAGNFVEYAGQVCKELDHKYASWAEAGCPVGAAVFRVDLTDKIHSTGTEQKVHNQHTGVVFDIDLAQMEQRNVKSGFARKVRRIVVQESVDATAAAQPLQQIAVVYRGERASGTAPTTGVPPTGWGAAKAKSRAVQRITHTSASASAAAVAAGGASSVEGGLGEDGLPADLKDDERAVLLLLPNMIIQTTKQRPDGWAFGKVIYDEAERGQAGEDFTSGLRWRQAAEADQRPADGKELVSKRLAQALQHRTEFSREEFDAFTDVHGNPIGVVAPGHFIAVGRVYFEPVVTTYSFQSGWFPVQHTDVPSAQQLQELQKQLGGDGASDALKAPPMWASMAEPLTPQMVLLTTQHGDEMGAVHEAFMATHDQRHNRSKKWQIVSVERVQNLSMWQSYAVKRQTVTTRDNALGDPEKERKLDKKWLFHGTDQDTVGKIIEMGFNRSFAGKNAVRYGKGVYFARDASYSDNYAAQDSQGIRRMFLCRVVVGQWCLGYNERLVPDVRTGQTLYDSTVNSMDDPIMWVTYNDAQAYPEYLVKYRHV